VHTAWGRTLKDVFQRYKAMRGYHQRYQNGFDCQGLWIEVGVERSLGLNSKREIEDYGLKEFAQRCREVVEWSSRELTEGSIRWASGWTGRTATSPPPTPTSSTSGSS
jgi:isoleucyl-tRNA synthetase